MDRREFLKSTGAAAAAATTATAARSCNVRASRTGPRFRHHGAAPRHRLARHRRGLADQARRLGQRLIAMSDGRYRIALPGIVNGLAAVRAGDADLYYATEHDHLDAHRALAYFSGLPGDRGIAARQLSAWMLVGGGQALWDDLAGEFGVKAMLAGHTGGAACFVASRRFGR